MAPDRDRALRQAEKLRRDGKHAAAIAAFQKIVDESPRDWTTANTLGDLLAKAGEVERAAVLYRRIAENLSREGFFPKAAAVYKKILKIKPDDEPACMQAAELHARQGLIADARQMLESVIERRLARGDARGAAAARARLNSLDPSDLESRLNGARLLADIGDLPGAVAEMKSIAEEYARRNEAARALDLFEAALSLDQEDEALRAKVARACIELGDPARAASHARTPADFKQLAHTFRDAGLDTEAVAALREAARLAPADGDVQRDLVRDAIAHGDFELAREYVSRDAAGTDAEMLLALVELELRSGNVDEGLNLVRQTLKLHPLRRERIARIAHELAPADRRVAYEALRLAVDVAAGVRDWTGAATMLREFANRAPDHIPTLVKLVEICVDGNLPPSMVEAAENRLADAQRAAGLDESPSPQLPPEPPRKKQAPARRVVETSDADDAEVDLTSALDEGEAEPARVPRRAEAVRDLEGIFRDFRDEVSRETAAEVAAQHYKLALTYREMGMIGEAIKALEIASGSPHYRFDAAALLGKLELERGEARRAIEWLERAVEAPAVTFDAGQSLLFELGSALELAGERRRALSVYLELQARVGDYRDIGSRIERLSTPAAEG